MLVVESDNLRPALCGYPRRVASAAWRNPCATCRSEPCAYKAANMKKRVVLNCEPSRSKGTTPAAFALSVWALLGQCSGPRVLNILQNGVVTFGQRRVLGQTDDDEDEELASSYLIVNIHALLMIMVTMAMRLCHSPNGIGR